LSYLQQGGEQGDRHFPGLPDRQQCRHSNSRAAAEQGNRQWFFSREWQARQTAAPVQRALEDLPKIGAKRDRIHIHKDVFIGITARSAL